MRLTFKSNLSDRQKGEVIKGIQIARVGKAEGHFVAKTQSGFEPYNPARHPESIAKQVVLSEKTLESIISCARASKSGIKCLMNHSDDINEVAGVFRDFRLDRECVRADLHLFDSSPKKDYVLEMAEKCPEGFGVSINFHTFYIENEHNTTNSTIDCMCKELSSCDLVTEPAATDGLFEAGDKNPVTNKTTKMETPEKEKEMESLSAEEVAAIAGEAVAKVIDEKMKGMEDMMSKYNEMSDRLSKLETPEEDPDDKKKEEMEDGDKEKSEYEEEEEKMAKMASKMAANIIAKLGMKKSLSASVSNEGDDTTKMTFTEHVEHVVKSGKSAIEANKEVMGKFPDKHKAHLATLTAKS